MRWAIPACWKLRAEQSWWEVATRLAGDGLSSNCLTQDLAHLIARQGRDIVDAGSGKSTELLVECGIQPFRIDRCRGFDDDMDLFLAAVVLHGEQTDAANAKELAQPILDGRRGNLLSSHIDDVGDASLQRHAPVRSHDGQIAGIEEAVLEEGPRRRFVIEIAGRPACGADPHSPDFAGRHGTIGFVDDLDHAAGHEPVPAVVLGSVQGSEGDDAGLSGSKLIEETRCNAGLGLVDLGPGHSSAADSELHRIVARERTCGRGQDGGEHCRVEHRVGDSGAQAPGTVRALAR